jgi:ubiquinone/menaquinone biosynthesis C-methylase UbiE
VRVTQVAAENEEAQRAWDGVLFDRFVAFRDVIVPGLASHGEGALDRHPPRPGARALDLGCGFGDTSARLGELVGPAGSVLGVDVAPRFIDSARAEFGAANVRFEVCDVQTADLGESVFDYAFSRFGTMFFALPVAALRNVRRALARGGRLCMVVWRAREDNPWVYRAETVVKPLVPVVEETDEARCGPGPFSMANADTVSRILLAAGFENVAFERFDAPCLIGRNLDEAVALNMALGPAAEAIRLAGAAAESLKPRLAALLREALAEFDTGDGVVAQSSTWIVTAQPRSAASSSAISSR